MKIHGPIGHQLPGSSLLFFLFAIPLYVLLLSRRTLDPVTMDENKKRLASEALASNDTRTRSSSSPPGHIANLIRFARTSYTENPTEALSALLEAMKLNNGQAAADSAMNRVRAELGNDIMDHVLDTRSRRDRAVQAVKRLLEDESTFLYQQGREDILRQTMEDGSSVVCSKCGGVVSSSRWEQHQSLWCENVHEEGTTATSATRNSVNEEEDSVMDIE